MKHGPLGERRAKRPVETVFQVHRALPLHHVGEQIAVKSGIVGQYIAQIQVSLGGYQLIERDDPRSHP